MLMAFWGGGDLHGRKQKKKPLCMGRVLNNEATLKLGVRGGAHEGEDKVMRVPFFRPGREQILEDELYVYGWKPTSIPYAIRGITAVSSVVWPRTCRHLIWRLPTCCAGSCVSKTTKLRHQSQPWLMCGALQGNN